MRKQNNAHHYWFLAVVISLSVFVSGGTAFGQFVVQPMRIDLSAMQRQELRTTLMLQSFDPNEVHNVDLYVVDLTQWEDGQWRIIEPNEDFDRSKLSSCRDWITLDSSSVQIQPVGSADVQVSVKVPIRTRGFYCAGIVAAIRPRPDLGGNIGVQVRFLVPVLMTVEGRPMRHDIQLKSMDLEFVPAFQDRPATTHALMNVDNDGGTRSSLKGFAQIKGYFDDHWRVISDVEFPGVSINPGSKLKLKASLGKPLPSGRYRIGGWLYVDGRRDQRVGNELTFAGDPSINNVAADAAIDLNPGNITIEAMPGATRVEGIKVFNASDEAVTVTAAVRLPQSLRGVAFGQLKGKDLDCTGWLEIEPMSFTLGSHRQRSIRIVSTMPNNVSPDIPCYYAMLGLVSTYADGQSAGVTTAPICVTNRNITVEPYVRAMYLRPALKEGNEYYIVARYGNFGRIHFTPVQCRAAIVDSTGYPRAVRALTSRKTSMLLPLEARDYSGVIDISEVPEGIYRLVTELRYGPDNAQKTSKQIGIRVVAQGGQKAMEVLQLRELGGNIEVQW